MVTTSSIEEIQDQFKLVLDKVIAMCMDIDQSEGDLRTAANTLFREAVGVVVPVLKYTDKQITFDHNKFRGVVLDKNTILSRDGWIIERGMKPVPYREYYHFFGGVDEMVDTTITRLNKLAHHFAKALSKADERQRKLAERTRKLQEAVDVFRK